MMNNGEEIEYKHLENLLIQLIYAKNLFLMQKIILVKSMTEYFNIQISTHRSCE